MRTLRDFPSIADFFDNREIDELQAAIDERREARAARRGDPGAEAADETSPIDREAEARPTA